MGWVVGLVLTYVAGAVSAVVVLAFFNIGGTGEQLEQRELKALRSRRPKKNGNAKTA